MKNFIYASTYLRVLEKYLLDKTDIQRMAGAYDAREALKVLENTNYVRDFKGLISKTAPEDYRRILFDDIKTARELLYFLVKDENIIKFILSFFDTHNIKLFFKEVFGNKDLTEFVSRHGSQDPQELKKAVERKKSKIDKEFQEIIDAVYEKYDKHKDPFSIDAYLDQKRMELLLKYGKKLRSTWVLKYVKLKIDLVNLQTIVRGFFLGKWAKAKELLIDGGNIDIKLLSSSSHMKETLMLTKKFLDEHIEKIINTYLDGGNIWKFIKMLDDYEMEYLKTSRFIGYGPEVVIAYFLARKYADRNVRIILEGKLNGIKSEEILERVRMSL